MDDNEGQVLHDIAAILASCGLDVTETRSSDGLPELAVTNPAAPAQGRIYVGYEGYVIWEYWTPADARSAPDELISIITTTLGKHRPVSASSAESAERPSLENLS